MAEPSKIDLAKEQLARVQVASWDPIDWADISSYGLYALENATVAAADHLGLQWERNHWSKAALAEQLAQDYGLPPVALLMRTLNAVRKSEVYGEPRAPIETSAEDVAIAIEDYVEKAANLIGGVA